MQCRQGEPILSPWSLEEAWFQVANQAKHPWSMWLRYACTLYVCASCNLISIVMSTLQVLKLEHLLRNRSGNQGPHFPLSLLCVHIVYCNGQWSWNLIEGIQIWHSFPVVKLEAKAFTCTWSPYYILGSDSIQLSFAVSSQSFEKFLLAAPLCFWVFEWNTQVQKDAQVLTLVSKTSLIWKLRTRRISETPGRVS